MFLATLLFLTGNCVSKNQEFELENRIVGGSPIPIELAPWSVIYGAQCGGVILRKAWILTAAHCSSLPNIRYKATTRTDGIIIWVDKWMPHKDYNSTTKMNDIQLLELEKEMEFDEQARPIRIACPCSFKAGRNLRVVGWGLLEENSEFSINNYSLTLMSAIVPMRSMRDCAAAYRNETLGNYYKLGRKMFCAGYAEGGPDACQGDSGSSATFRKRLVGLVSFGTGCGRAARSGVYTFVPAYKRWILCTINGKCREKIEQFFRIAPEVYMGKRCTCKKTNARRLKKRKCAKSWRKKYVGGTKKQIEIQKNTEEKRKFTSEVGRA